MRTIRTHTKRDALLEAIAEGGGNISAACRSVGVSRSAFHDWKREDPGFSADVETALERGLDALEDEARRRAFSGVRRDVYHNGQVVGREIRYSDTLLIFMLKSRRPDVFGEKRAVTLAGDLSLTHLRGRSREELATRLAELEANEGQAAG